MAEGASIKATSLMSGVAPSPLQGVPLPSTPPRRYLLWFSSNLSTPFLKNLGLHKLPTIALHHGQTKIETTVDTLRVMQMSPKGACGVLLESTLFLFLFTFLCHLWFANDGRPVL